MAVIPAQVQQVRESFAIPQDNPFLTMVNAGLQGYFQRQNEPKTQFASAFPVLAQMGMLKPSTQGTPGAYPFAGNYWTTQEKPGDLSDFKTLLDIKDKQQDLDPVKQATKWALDQWESTTQKVRTQNALNIAFNIKPMPEPDMQTYVSKMRDVYLQQMNAQSETPMEPTETVQSSSTRVKIKDKKGNRFTIPATQLQQALKQGYSKV